MAADPAPDAAPVDGVRHVESKALLLLAALLALLVGSGLFLLYARGAFEVTQDLVLLADDSEGVTVGMDLTFSGFPIGRVRRIELGPDGNARIIVDVPLRDARWLRSSSIFTLERSLVGSTRLRAFSGVLDDPPLAAGAVRQVLKGDAMAEVPQLVSAVRDLLRNVNAMTAEQSPINETLRELKAVVQRLRGPRGAVGVLMGNDKDARQVALAVERSNALLQRLDEATVQARQLAGRVDALVGRADERVFGEGGLAQDTQATVRELQALLGQARASLRQVDAVLVEAQGVAANTRAATVDLVALRAAVEASLRKVDGLVNEVNRKWPFARDSELRLP